jgi:hypothetical protein
VYRIDHSPKDHESFRRGLQLASLAELLPDAEVEELCRDAGMRWRSRKLPPAVMLRSMVHRGLNPDHSIAATLADLGAASAPIAEAPTDAAWCQARDRMPESVLVELGVRRAHECRQRFGEDCRWHGRWVYRIDGTTVSMPDEPSLAKAFGYSSNNHGLSRFPIARVTFIELAGLSEIWNYRLNDYRTSEESQLYDMWDALLRGCICLLDRKFCSFYVLAKLRQRQIAVVTPLHQSRDPQQLIRAGRQIGDNEWIVPLTLTSHLRRKYQDDSLPQKVSVRLIRVTYPHGQATKVLWLVTTLMDPQEYPHHEVSQLYRTRWEIEPRIGSLKTTLEMNVLRSKSPAAVRREVAAIVLGHNLVWMLIHESARETGTPVQKISFAGAVKTAVAYSPRLAAASPQEYPLIHQQMLRHIARVTNHHPRGRVEPRLVKRQRTRFNYLRKPRSLARAECLS